MCLAMVLPHYGYLMSIGNAEGELGSIQAVELPNGQVIWARVSSDGPTDTAGLHAKSVFDTDELLKTISGIAETVHESVAKLRPDAIGVEFGIELTLRAGKLIGVLADISGSTSLKVSMGWGGAEKPPPPGNVSQLAAE